MPTFHSFYTKKPLEALTIFPPLRVATRGNFDNTNQTELKTNLCLVTHNLGARAVAHHIVLSPPEGMEDALTMVNGSQEDDIVVRDGEGMDGASLDSLHNLFHGWQYRSPYQAPEVALGPLAPFRATPGIPSPGSSPGSDSPNMEEHLAAMHQKLRDEVCIGILSHVPLTDF